MKGDVRMDSFEPSQSLVELFEKVLKELRIPENEHTEDTPRRMAEALCELTESVHTEPPEIKTFDYDKADELVIDEEIPYVSLCAHHFLPFGGHVTIGYVTRDKIAGLSKFARLVEWVSKKPQTQELMTGEIADIIMEQVNPKGVMVIVEGEHMCQVARGIKKPSKMITSAIRGVFETKGGLNPRQEMMDLVKK